MTFDTLSLWYFITFWNDSVVCELYLIANCRELLLSLVIDTYECYLNVNYSLINTHCELITYICFTNSILCLLFIMFGSVHSLHEPRKQKITLAVMLRNKSVVYERMPEWTTKVVEQIGFSNTLCVQISSNLKTRLGQSFRHIYNAYN